jgi:hypothetical protein
LTGDDAGSGGISSSTPTSAPTGLHTDVNRSDMPTQFSSGLRSMLPTSRRTTRRSSNPTGDVFEFSKLWSLTGNDSREPNYPSDMLPSPSSRNNAMGPSPPPTESPEDVLEVPHWSFSEDTGTPPDFPSVEPTNLPTN